MAEYNNNCVEKIKIKIKKLPTITNDIQKFFKANNVSLEGCFQGWELPNWFDTSDLGDILYG